MFSWTIGPPLPHPKIREKTKAFNISAVSSIFSKKNARNCRNVKNVKRKVLEIAEMLRMLKMLNVFWTIEPPLPPFFLWGGGGPMVQKTFNIFNIFNISAVSSTFLLTFLTFQQFRAFFPKYARDNWNVKSFCFFWFKRGGSMVQITFNIFNIFNISAVSSTFLLTFLTFQQFRAFFPKYARDSWNVKSFCFFGFQGGVRWFKKHLTFLTFLTFQQFRAFIF